MKTLTTVLAVTLLTISPALPILSFDESGAAFANNGNGGGNGNGGNGNGGNGNGGNGGNGKSESKSAKSEKSEKSVAKSETKKKKAKLDGAGIEVVKGKAPAEGELAPNELGKMNGALNANMNAVLAHIRNGQTTNGPVGLLAGLAIADAEAAEALTVAGELSAIAVAFDALSSGLTEAGFGSVEDYLQAKADGTLTEDQVALVDPLIDAVGGTTQDGLALAETPPTAEEILAAEAAAEAARQGVTDAETAIGDAWNKEGDLATLLSLLRDKLAGNQAEIDAAIKETNGLEDLAEVTPVDAEVVN